ncbi:MAG TPA: hypothetical protein VKB60_00595, partial [Terriglobales bacterium]|nr:hypothetical protein [Terriglobales bacterium]
STQAMLAIEIVGARQTSQLGGAYLAELDQDLSFGGSGNMAAGKRSFNLRRAKQRQQADREKQAHKARRGAHKRLLSGP